MNVVRIYIDSDYRCHVDNDGTMREIDTPDFFNNKCRAFIEGYRVKPDGEIWVREDGEVFDGGMMISPWVDYDVLLSAQAEYEQQQKTIREYEAALTEIEEALGVTFE